MRVLDAIGHALTVSGSMTWQILWALIFGFVLSAVVQAVVRRSTIVKRLGDDRPRTLLIATGFGVASSLHAPMRRWLSPALCSSVAPPSRLLWHSRSLRPTWSWSLG